MKSPILYCTEMETVQSPILYCTEAQQTTAVRLRLESWVLQSVFETGFVEVGSPLQPVEGRQGCFMCDDFNSLAGRRGRFGVWDSSTRRL